MAHVGGRHPGCSCIRGLALHLLLAAAFILQLAGTTAQAQGMGDETVVARRVKAAYLYRFTAYVQWPPPAFASADSPLVIGVLGNDLLAEDLATLVAGRTFDGRRFEVRKLRRTDALAGLHILYLRQDSTSQLSHVLSGLPPLGTLLITDSPGALAHGSAINFLLVDEQVRFELSLEAAEKFGLKLSSRLVNVSHNLSGKGR